MAEIEQLPAVVPLRIVRGDSWTQQLTFRVQSTGAAVDITGWEVTCQIRPAPDVDPAVDVGVDNGGADGTVTLRLSAADSATLPVSCVWDLQRVDGADVRTLIGGPVTVSRDVTHG